MHKFPDASDLQFLVGLEVGQVCLDPWTVQLRFGDGGQITIEGEFQHTDLRGDVHIHQAGEERDTGPFFLGELVQDRISGLEATPLRLTLSFSNGGAVSILTEEGPYECGQIYAPGEPSRLIVF